MAKRLCLLVLLLAAYGCGQDAPAVSPPSAVSIGKPAATPTSTPAATLVPTPAAAYS